MKTGDTIYYVNSGRQIDKYKIEKIENREVHVIYESEDGIVQLRANFNLDDFYANKCPRLFTKEEEALALKHKLDDEYEANRQARMDKILQEALESTTLSEVESHGVLLKTKRTDYENYYSDSPGGEYYEANLYQYNGVQYIVVYKIVDDSHGRRTKQCVQFSERKYAI